MTLLQITEGELMEWVTGLLYPFVRIGALLLAAPMFGARTVPVRARLALAMLLAIVVFPFVSAPSDVQPLSLPGVLLLFREVVIGVCLGMLMQMVFAAVAIAGETIAMSMGLAFASMVDPERGGSVPLVGQHFVVYATLLFLAFDGHLALLMLLIESFEWLPPAATGLGGEGFLALAGWGSRMFEAAVLVALPAAAALLVASVSMGLIARSAPQLNIFAVGFPMTLMLGIAALLFSMPLLAGQLEMVLAAVLDHGRVVFGGWQ